MVEAAAAATAVTVSNNKIKLCRLLHFSVLYGLLMEFL